MVGGGPAGAICGRSLGRAGLSAAVLDRSAPPRYKACGGGLVWRARRLLESDLDGVVERECFAAALNHLDAGLSYRVTRRVPVVTMTMRSALDRRLLEAAGDAGAELVAPCAVRGIEPGDGGIRLTTEHGALRARFVVAADGAGSAVARAAGWQPPRRSIPALESELRVDRQTWEHFSSEARFDFGYPPNGYGWVFPKGQHLSVGCLSTRPGRRSLKRDLEEYLAHLGLSPGSDREDHGFVIPIAPRSAPLARDRILLAGDAAGLADPVTGEGITHALLSGRLAAESIAAHFGAPAEACAHYSRALAGEILPELRIARLLAPLLYDFPILRRTVFRRLGRPLCEEICDVFTGELTYRKLLGRPRSYLRAALRFLAPGAA